MAKRKPRRRRLRPVADAEIDEVLAQAGGWTTPAAGDLSLHQLFDQHTRAILDASDLDEEEKQSILLALQCPCCGSRAASLTVKLKARK